MIFCTGAGIPNSVVHCDLFHSEVLSVKKYELDGMEILFLGTQMTRMLKIKKSNYYLRISELICILFTRNTGYFKFSDIFGWEKPND